jgi:hypothetical protein
MNVSANEFIGLNSFDEKNQGKTFTLNIDVRENKEVISKMLMVFQSEEDIIFTNDLTFSGYPVEISYNGVKKLPENYISMRRTKDQKSIVEFELNGCYSKSEIDFKLNDKHLLSVCRGSQTIKITKHKN